MCSPITFARIFDQVRFEIGPIIVILELRFVFYDNVLSENITQVAQHKIYREQLHMRDTRS